jgi:hypothetical protein
MTATRPATEPAAWEPPPELTDPAAAPSAAPPPAAAAPRALEATGGGEALRRAEERLRGADRRDAVIDAALELAGGFAELAALFVVRDGVAAGLRALRAGAPFEVEAIVAPLGGEGVFADAVRTLQPARRVPSAALDKVVAKALRSEAGAELAVFPIAIGGRVVNLLVAQPASGALPATAAAALAVAAQIVGASYERLIRTFKQQSTDTAS